MKKILLVGDSIRVGYDKYVKMAFEGVAHVYYPDENTRFAAYVCRNLDCWQKWLCGDDIDVIHWNAGLWDNLPLPDGKLLTPINVYKEYVERICVISNLLFPCAKMIFATSTPVRDRPDLPIARRNEDTEKYNAAAVEIVKRYGGQINDLYSLAKAAPDEYHSDGTHYYTKEGTRMLTDQVVKCLEQTLGIRAKALDYDALFTEPESIVGI